MTYSEVENVTGFVGNFRATIRQKARYVDPELCNACGECIKVCPTALPDEYQVGLSSRRAIYIPFPQAVPCSYILDMEHCLGTTRLPAENARMFASRRRSTMTTGTRSLPGM